MRWIVLFAIAIVIAVFAAATSEGAVAKAITMCGTINVPTKKGKCRTTTIMRFGKAYKVRVCLS